MTLVIDRAFTLRIHLTARIRRILRQRSKSQEFCVRDQNHGNSVSEINLFMWRVIMEYLQQIEDSIMLFLQSIRNPVLSAILVPFTKSGNHGIIVIALILLTLFFKSERKTFFTAALGLILGSLVTIILLKPYFMRPRPYAAIEGLTALVNMKKDPNSFPSGHTTAAFALAMGWQLASEKKWMKIFGWIFAVLMGFSRLYVGVHYPTDVLAGALIGTMGSVIAWLIVKRVFAALEKRKREKNEGI